MFNDDFKEVGELIMDWILSDERERIIDPEVDVEKYVKYVCTIQKCTEWAEKHHMRVSYDDPKFPQSIQMITLVMPTQDDEIEIGKEGLNIFEMISYSDSVIMDTDLKGNIRINIFFQDIYKERV